MCFVIDFNRLDVFECLFGIFFESFTWVNHSVVLGYGYKAISILFNRGFIRTLEADDS